MSKREKEITRVTVAGAAVNILLSVGKIVCGVAGCSAAMVADGIHSLSDLATDVIVLVFVRIAAKPADREHDFGHGKFETLATALVGVALAGVALKIGWDGARLIAAAARGQTIPQPTALAAAAAAVSVAVKEGLFRWTRAVGVRCSAPAVVANAWHHRSDAISSVGTLAGISGALLLGGKWTVLDPLASLAVTALILKVAAELTGPAVGELLEKSLPKEMEDDILALVSADARVHDPHNLRTRRLGANIAVEVHIRLDPALTVLESHAVTVGIENAVKNRFGPGSHVIVHVEPRRA